VRLALVATFARRGVNLPMVLDDVLVNFDVGRAQKAAEVLTEFAAAGHQLLFFTCHEHIWNMLKALDADCRRLPVRRGQSEPEPMPAAAFAPEPEPVAPPKPTRAPAKRKPRRVKTTIVVEQPRDEWFEYPFVERLVAAPAPLPLPEPLESPLEVAPAWCEYSFEPSEFTRRAREHEDDLAVAYIVGDDGNREGADDQTVRRRRVRTIIGGAAGDYTAWGDDSDRRESRRA
jgi:hypothetical protein